jgi:hypothetical protein
VLLDIDAATLDSTVWRPKKFVLRSANLRHELRHEYSTLEQKEQNFEEPLSALETETFTNPLTQLGCADRHWAESLAGIRLPALQSNVFVSTS